MSKIDRRTKEGRKIDSSQHTREMILQEMPRLYYVEDQYNGGYRVGRSDWAGDQFNLVPKAEFDIFLKVLNGLSYPIDDKTWED